MDSSSEVNAMTLAKLNTPTLELKRLMVPFFKRLVWNGPGRLPARR